MKPASMVVGISALALGMGLAVSPAYAATGLVDGSITVGDSSCTWANAVTSDAPPNTLTVDHTTVHPTCNGSITVALTNNPTVTFNDAAGTASSASIVVSGTILGINCGYTVSGVSIARSGSTRTYSGGPFTANKSSGGFLCPGSETVDSATFTFH